MKLVVDLYPLIFSVTRVGHKRAATFSTGRLVRFFENTVVEAYKIRM